MSSRIDSEAKQPFNETNDWQAWIQLSTGQFMLLQFGSIGINKERADEIVRKIAELDL